MTTWSPTPVSFHAACTERALNLVVHPATSQFEGFEDDDESEEESESEETLDMLEFVVTEWCSNPSDIRKWCIGILFKVKDSFRYTPIMTHVDPKEKMSVGKQC